MTKSSPTKTIFIEPSPNWRQNADLFFQYPQLRTAKYRALGPISDNVVLRRILEGDSDDPVSQVFRGIITPERQVILDALDNEIRARNLNEEARRRFQIPAIRALIAGNVITIDQVLLERPSKFAHFEGYGLLMIAFLVSKKLSWLAVVNIGNNRINLLEWRPMVQAIARGDFSQEQVICFPKNTLRNLNHPIVRQLVEAGACTLDRALLFTRDNRLDLEWAWRLRGNEGNYQRALLRAGW